MISLGMLESYFCNNKSSEDAVITNTTFTGEEMHLMVSSVSLELNEYAEGLTERGVFRCKDFLDSVDDEHYFADHFDDTYEVEITYDDISIIITAIKHCLEREDYSATSSKVATKIIAKFVEIYTKDTEGEL